jgi:hypothetical protein
VFPGGTEIGLEIHRALRFCKDIELFSAGSAVSNHAPYVFRNHFVIPTVTSGDWIEPLNRVLDDIGIDYIFPAHDDVITALDENRDRIHAEPILSPSETCGITRSKSETYERFSGILPVPRQYRDPSSVERFPVFLKPDRGQGSQRTYKADNIDELKTILAKEMDLIILEFLGGKEYTIDCFSDRRSGLLYCQGRERIRVRAGISMNSKPVGRRENAVFTDYATVINQTLDLYGAWFFQMKRDDSGELKLLEIAPRIGGTMAMSRVSGVNLPLLRIYEHEGIDLAIMTNDYEVEIDRALTNRYKHNLSYDKIYVDLDDTLVINGKVNSELVSLLYQAAGNDIRVFLLTRTKENVTEYLRRFRIEGLFDDVILLDQKTPKADYIDTLGSIFIDDSFSERKAVSDRLGIPTFDCSMIELLINERV